MKLLKIDLCIKAHNSDVFIPYIHNIFHLKESSCTYRVYL